MTEVLVVIAVSSWIGW